MMEYLVGDNKYILHYSEIREHYYKFCSMKDAEFMHNLPAAAHFACVVCWLKKVGMEASIGDRGIVHMLIHQMEHGDVMPTEPLKDVRRLFKKLLVL